MADEQTPPFDIIVKRNGTRAPFNQFKITNAIFKALKATNCRDHTLAQRLSDDVITRLQHAYPNTPPTVEGTQDIVETVLIDHGLTETAKAYIRYRQQHTELRNLAALLSSTDIVDQYLNKLDWRVTENSNMSYSLQGLNNYLSSTIIANYWLHKLYPTTIAKAHSTADMHIHDLGVLGAYCVGWDLRDLLVSGFGHVPGKITSSPAKHLRTALGHIVNFFYTLQGEAAGAQAFSNFDTYLAPFVRKDKLDYKQVKQAMQEFMFSVNVPTRVGFQCMSEDTEILTSDGWKSHANLRVGELIYTFNVMTGNIEEKPISHLFSRHYSGVMYNLRNRIQDQLISPGHRVVRKKFNSDRFILEEIEQVKELKSPFIIPISGKNPRSDVEYISDDEIRILAWVIADGTTENNRQKHRHCGRITIYQSKKVKKRNHQEIQELLKQLELTYRPSVGKEVLGKPVNRFRINAASSRKIRAVAGAESEIKFIPRPLLNMSRRQSRLFLETYMKGDGFEDCKISTTFWDIVVGLQQLCVNAEWGFTVLKRKPTKIGTKPVFVVRIIRHQDTYIQQINEVNYKGIIWCPTTENNTVIAKRNEKVFITGNTPFTNITMDMEPSPNLKDEPVIIGGEFQDEAYSDYQDEMNMINNAFAEVMLDGDANGRVFTFPIPTYNIAKDFDWSNPIMDKVFEMAAKYGIPYFANFVNSDMSPEDSRSMCCRLRLDNRELRKRGGGLFGASPLTGSIGVVTLNLPRVGYLAKDDTDYFERIDDLIELASSSLELKRKILERYTELGLYPYSRYFLRDIIAQVGSYWSNHFSTIGIVGLNESLMNYLGVNIVHSEGRKFGLRVMDHFRERLSGLQETTGNMYNFEATPAEGASHRLARLDVKRYPDIVVANDLAHKTKDRPPFYTNCVSEDTECLTKTGWKKHFEINIGDEILTLNIGTKQLEYQKVLFMNRQKINNAEMYHIKSKRQDQLITPNHRILYDGDRKRHYRFAVPTDLPYRLIIPTAGQYNGGMNGTHSNDFIELLGWIITDGSFAKDSAAIRITQAEWKNPEKFFEIKELLDRLGYKYTIHGDKRGRSIFRIAAENGRRIRQYIDSKNIPRWCLNDLPQGQLRLLRDTMMKGNGSISEHSQYYSTGDPNLADEFQELCLKTNSRAVISDYRDTTASFHIVPSIYYHTEIVKKNVTMVRYSGIVWCPTVPNGTFVARRNNKPFITGNSSQLPVDYVSDVFEALEHQDEFQTKYTGGTVFHMFMGERPQNWQAVRELVRTVCENFHLPYFTLTPSFSVCPCHGYIAGEHEFCPRCDEEIMARSQDHQVTEGISNG